MASQVLDDSELFPKDETKKLYDETVALLLKNAREQDEKEFMSSILYFRGILTYSRAYDVSRELGETIELFFQLTFLRNKHPEIMSVQAFFKLGLLVYCHIIETYPTFEFLYNLSLLAQGKDYRLHPFGNAEEKSLSQAEVQKQLQTITKEANFDKQKALISKLSYQLRISEMPIVARIQKIVKESNKAKVPLKDILNDIYDKDIRNAFSHGHYCLDQKGMSIIRKYKTISYRDLLDKITKCLHFYVTLADQANDVLASLPANKPSTFKGRLGEMTITPNIADGFVSYQIQSTSLSKHI